MRLLVTAGNTRERIDAVREWGSIFTGNTGFAIAKALAELGEVDLLTSNRSHLSRLKDGLARPYPVVGHEFASHAELKAALAALMGRHNYDAVFMSAAVADYRPSGVYAVIGRRPDAADPTGEQWIVRDVQAAKVKSTHSAIAVLAEQTEKLVDLFRTDWGYRGLLVKFKLEVGMGVDELLRIGENSRLASGADYLVANTLEMVNGPRPGAYLLGAAGHEWVAREKLPERMVSLVRESTNRGGGR